MRSVIKRIEKLQESVLLSIYRFYEKLSWSVLARRVDPIIGSLRGVLRHPALGVPQCRKCREFYKDGNWPRTEDGDEYCRWCAEGGDILLCDKCPNAFCKKCLNKNLGARAVREITKAEEWFCLLCDPTPIKSLKAQYMKIYKSQEEIKERRKLDRKKGNLKAKYNMPKKPAPVKSPRNFLGNKILFIILNLEKSS